MKYTRQQLVKEVMWWRDYGYYVANAHNNVNAEACAYADGDDEFQEMVNGDD